MKARYQNRIESLQGTLDLLTLQNLQWSPRRDYVVSQAIRTNSGEAPQFVTGPLYQALYRLERQKYINSEAVMRILNQARKESQA
jgi:DNA-binding PadR family transcriptional regulator